MPTTTALRQEDCEDSQPPWGYKATLKQQQQSGPHLMAKMYLIFEVSFMSQETYFF